MGAGTLTTSGAESAASLAADRVRPKEAAGNGRRRTCAFKLLQPGFQIMGVGLQHVVSIAQALHVCFQLGSRSLGMTGCAAPSDCFLLCLLQLPYTGAGTVTSIPQ